MVTINPTPNLHKLAGKSVVEQSDERFREYRRLWSERPRNFSTGNFPLFLDIEVTNMCNYRCSFCATAYFDESMKRGVIKPEFVKKIIDEGKLGNIYSVQLNCFWNRNDEYYNNSDWKGTKKLDGGILFTQFSHFIDLLFWMIGDVKEIYAFHKNFSHQNIIEFEDTGVVVLKFFNGVLGTINYTINSYAKNMEGSITIFSEKGTVKIGGQYLNELEYQMINNFEIKDLPKGNPPNNYGKYVGSMSNHDKVYKNVVEVLKNDGVIATNGFEGLKTVEIIEKIYANTKINQ